MKITEALCNVITEAGGTPTTADSDSITHALGTLYTTLGGTDTLPDDVADRINSLSDHIGGGSATVETSTVRIVNNASGRVSVNPFAIKEVNGKAYATCKTQYIGVSETADIAVAKDYNFAGTAMDTAYFAKWCCEVLAETPIDPDKVAVSANVGTVSLLRNTVGDGAKTKSFLLFIKSTTTSAKQQMVITISESA